MASNKRSAKRPPRPAQNRQTTQGGPRRLGGQQAPPRSASAQRRYERSRRSRRTSNWQAWAGVLVVVAVVLAFAIYKLTTHTPASKTGSNLHAAPAALVSELSTIPSSTFDSVGTDKSPDPFTETAGQAPLALGGKPQFVFVGAEYCPYCALTRWALVTALGHFGTFKNLRETSSSADFAPIPTFSFLGATYTSPYIKFTPYETEDRNGATLTTPPKYVEDLYKKYDGTGSTPTKFSSAAGVGIPFLDIGNLHVSSGAPNLLDGAINYLAGGGPGGYTGIAYAITHPDSTTGKEFGRFFVAVANYDMAAICTVDGGKPGSVCNMSGVKAAERVMAAKKKVS